MFRGVGRRLALLNALVVIAIIALTGAATYLLLLNQLDAEVDTALEATAEQTARSLRYGLPPPVVTGGERRERDDDDDYSSDDEEILASGDTIIFAVDPSGHLIYNPRGLETGRIPSPASAARALDQEEDRRSLTIDGVGPVRVVSVLVRKDGEVIAAVQVVRSLREHDAELATVRWMTLLGIGLGTAIAVPAGLFLAHRAMRPIDAAFARQRTFVADASHELRTPLTLIRANAEIARQDPTAPVVAIDPEHTSILDEVDRTDRLVDDLLTLARADASRLDLHREPVDVAALVREVHGAMTPMARQRGVALHVETPQPAIALIDAERIQQVLRILLDNALKHTPAGGDVHLSTSAEATQIRIVVADTGTGIPPADLPHVFDRFYRVDQARSRAAGGSGLGLPIARALVEAHGGTITLTSTLHHGTTVTVTLPTPSKL